ncbi:DUF6527 family protein [Pseudoxanthomonas japonensis]|uniref:DUF6527 family protein n=1 Tax=Pseudoxanthomonas japonensis TaxID=69284 RepID=UPI001BCB3145|nr:DUF6527 family protein [Pseudoxanthomonas japonensis]
MIRFHSLEPRFVVAVPQALEPGVLYVSMEYGTVVHSCCCGCGAEVVTPLTPTDWHLSYDGEAISLRPSVGNWNLPCRSHYVISRNQVIESGSWSQERVEAEQRRDRRAKAAYYQSMNTGGAESSQGQIAASPPRVAAPDQQSWLRRLWRDWSKLW